MKNVTRRLPNLTRRNMIKGALVAGVFLGAETEGQPAPLNNKPTIAIVLYDGFTQLDVMGPYQFLSALMEHQTIFVAKKRGIVTSDSGMKIMVDYSFEDCPKDLVALLVGGGNEGTMRAIRDPETIAFFSDRAKKARYVTSVCTGSLILAAAGLLDDKKATTHWGVVDGLAAFGVQVVQERVVEDGNVITGAGVSAGLDLGLLLMGKIAGDEYAQEVQSFIEYNPKPKYSYRDPYKPESGMAKYKPLLAPLVKDATQAGADYRERRRKSNG